MKLPRYRLWPGARGVAALAIAAALLAPSAVAAGQPDRRAMAADWLRNLAEKGTPEGRIVLLDQALQGYAEAQYALATMYRGGAGIARDMIQARRWYRAAAGQGHAAALESLRSLAEQGDSAAFYALGVLSRDGLGVPRDPADARQAFRWAGAGGDILALFAAAEMMLNGRGGVVDELGALRGFRQAARVAGAALGVAAEAAGAGAAEMTIPEQTRRGRAKAQYWIGRAYLKGAGGVERNPAAAARWFDGAANTGLDRAQYELGRLYARGRGVPRDPRRALAWLEQAAAQGMSLARAEIARLEK